jgi:hypothetical protein
VRHVQKRAACFPARESLLCVIYSLVATCICANTPEIRVAGLLALLLFGPRAVEEIDAELARPRR